RSREGDEPDLDEDTWTRSSSKSGPDLVPRTPEDSEKESDDEEEQESRLSEEAR
nr:hypothetical protein [Tanacetum cinerariifolium]